MNGSVRHSKSPSPPHSSAANGFAQQSRSETVDDERHPAAKSNGSLSPVLNGVIPKSLLPPDARRGLGRDIANKKDKLGLKLASLGLALTSQALVHKQPPSAIPSLERGSIMDRSRVPMKEYQGKSALIQSTAPFPVATDDSSTTLSKDRQVLSTAPKSTASRMKPEPFIVKDEQNNTGADDKRQSHIHSITEKQRELLASPVPAELGEASEHPVTNTGVEKANAARARKEHRLSQNEDKTMPTKGQSTAPPVIPSFSTAAPALSMTRSSPRVRKRHSVNDTLLSIKTLIKDTPSFHLPVPPTAPTVSGAAGSSKELTAQIHEVEAKIISLERELGNIRNKAVKAQQMSRSPSKKKKGGPRLHMDAESESKKRYAALAQKILESAERIPITKRPKPSPVPMHAAFRLLLTQNRTKAAAAHAKCRCLHSDSEFGLTPSLSSSKLALSKVSEEVLRKVAHELKRRRHTALERRRKLAREYSIARETWARRLKSARDKRSREKREAIRERDRCILLSTKGSSALLTQRTSSGRTSTKIFPSISPNGPTNGMAGLDAQLAEIEAAGGTPGFNAIWSKTLALIPDQDFTYTPVPCTSVLVEDPLADFLASRAVNPWRFDEKLVFLDKFLAYPKNFRKISSFLTHKSSRDCSYFYYTNKLNLGLKQLVKEYQSLKRKGTLRQHIMQVARRHTTNTVPVEKQLTKGEVDTVISGAEASIDHLGIDGRGQTYPWFTDVSVVFMKRSERVLIDFGVVDLDGIDRKSFAHALSIHGADWKAISMQMRVEGKTSTHYREYFRQNRKALEREALLLQRLAKLPMSMRRSLGARSKSPRMSPRSSPRASPRSSSTSNDKLKLVLPLGGISLPNGSILSKPSKRRDAGGLGWDEKNCPSVRVGDNGKNEREPKHGHLANAHH
ncbi:unnamed protein product [Agarophyton chilense]